MGNADNKFVRRMLMRLGLLFGYVFIKLDGDFGRCKVSSYFINWITNKKLDLAVRSEGDSV